MQSFRVLAFGLWLLSVALIVVIGFASVTGSAANIPLIGGMLGPEAHFLDRLTIIAITLLFAWVLVALGHKAIEVNGQFAALQSFKEIMAAGAARPFAPRRFAKRAPRGVGRANVMIECSSNGDPSCLHEVVPSLAALDAGTLGGSYGPLNVYAWLLPVLGFIGTASGMSTAIGGFKGALQGVTTGGGDKLAAITTILSQTVIPGLAGAFQTTMLALGASLVTYVCTNALRMRDQEALDELDRLSVLILKDVPLPAPEGKETIRLLELIAKAIKDNVHLPETLEDAAKELNESARILNSASLELRETAKSLPYEITISRPRNAAEAVAPPKSL